MTPFRPPADHCDTCKWLNDPKIRDELDSLLRRLCRGLADDAPEAARHFVHGELGVSEDLLAALVRGYLDLTREQLRQIAQLRPASDTAIRWFCDPPTYARPVEFVNSDERLWFELIFKDGRWTVAVARDRVRHASGQLPVN